MIAIVTMRPFLLHWTYLQICTSVSCYGMTRHVSFECASRYSSRLLSRQALTCRTSCSLITPLTNRDFQTALATRLPSIWSRRNREFTTSFPCQNKLLDATTSADPGASSDRRSKAEFRAVDDFLIQNDVYERGSHEGRPSINLRSAELTDMAQIQERLAWFFGIHDLGKSVTGQQHLLLEVAKDVYISGAGESGSNACVKIEFDRTSAGNSLNSTILDSLALIFETLYSITSLRGVLFTGAAGRKQARAFSSGADIKEMQQLRNTAEATQFIKRISRVCTAIRKLQVPVLCGIDGSCIGAGLEIAASCDLRIATCYSIFAMPEVKLAIPSVVEARLLCDIIGVGRTKHFLLTGETIHAETALDYGLVTKLFDDRTQLLTWSTKLLEEFSTSLNVRTSQKDLMRKWESSNLEEGIVAGITAFADRFGDSYGDKVRGYMRDQWNKLKSGRK